MEILKWWKNIVYEQNIYFESFKNAAKNYVINLSLEYLLNYIQELKNNSLIQESKLMLSVAFSKSFPEEISKPLTNWLINQE